MAEVVQMGLICGRATPSASTGARCWLLLRQTPWHWPQLAPSRSFVWCELPTSSVVCAQRRHVLRLRRADEARAVADSFLRNAVDNSHKLSQQMQRRGRAAAWALLERIVEDKEANEYHFSLVLHDGCRGVEDLECLTRLMKKAELGPNHVLDTGLHAAWAKHERFGEAVAVLVAAHKSGRLGLRKISSLMFTALRQLADRQQLLGPYHSVAFDTSRGGGSGGGLIPMPCATWQAEYFGALNIVGLVDAAHFRLAALRLCRTKAEVQWMAAEMRRGGLATLGVAGGPTRVKRGGDRSSCYIALHGAWLGLGEVGAAVAVLEEARAALYAAAQEATTATVVDDRSSSHDIDDPDATLSRVRSAALRELLLLEPGMYRRRVLGQPSAVAAPLAWEYFQQLQERSIADIFQYALMGELGCESRSELVALFQRKIMVPHWATYITLHHVWVRLGKMNQAVAQLSVGVANAELTLESASGVLNATISALTAAPTAAPWLLTQDTAAAEKTRTKHDIGTHGGDCDNLGEMLGSGSGSNGGGGGVGASRSLSRQPVVESWQLRPVREADDAGLSVAVGSSSGGEGGSGWELARGWAYFRAVQRLDDGTGRRRRRSVAAAAGGGDGGESGVLRAGREQYKRMVTACTTAEQLRSLLADLDQFEDEALQSQPGTGDANDHQGIDDGNDAETHAGWRSKTLQTLSRLDDIAFAETVHETWLMFGDPVAAVAVLARANANKQSTTRVRQCSLRTLRRLLSEDISLARSNTRPPKMAAAWGRYLSILEEHDIAHREHYELVRHTNKR